MKTSGTYSEPRRHRSPAKMFLVNYETPNGAKRHNRLWNGGTVRLYSRKLGRYHLVDEVIAENVGCEYEVYGN